MLLRGWDDVEGKIEQGCRQIWFASDLLFVTRL